MQIRGSHKTKQNFFLVAKFLVLALTLIFLYQTLQQHKYAEFVFLTSALFSSRSSILFIFFLLLLSTLNWGLEIKKWQILVKDISNISFVNAMKQTLMAFTCSVITPAKAGDFITKTLFFSSRYRTRVIWLNTINNGTQLIATLFFGSIGIGLLSNVFPEIGKIFPPLNFRWFMLGGILCVILGLVVWTYFIKIPFQNFIRATLKVSRTLILRVQLLSFLKYLVFSFQFYTLLIYFEIHITYGLAMSLIATLYLLNSVIPTSAALDTITKGGLAVFLFGIAEIQPSVVLLVIFVMWVFNYLVPALIGMYFLTQFRAIKAMDKC